MGIQGLRIIAATTVYIMGRVCWLDAIARQMACSWEQKLPQMKAVIVTYQVSCHDHQPKVQEAALNARKSSGKLKKAGYIWSGLHIG